MIWKFTLKKPFGETLVKNECFLFLSWKYILLLRNMSKCSWRLLDYLQLLVAMEDKSFLQNKLRIIANKYTGLNYKWFIDL